MDISILNKAGLTDSQARAYMALVEHGTLTPTKLAAVIDETRTNGYMLCDKLVSLGLAAKKDGNKAVYIAAHPSALEALVERRRKILVRNEQEVKAGLSPLIDLFYANNELPGTRTLQGIDGIKEVYKDTLRAKQDIYLLRTIADIPDLGQEYLDTYRKQRAIAGIHTYALTPDTEVGRRYKETGEDDRMLFHRTLLPDQSYTAPVEIDIYGNKVALISFGQTQMATIIDSPAVAEAMRQLMQIITQLLP